MCLVGLAASVWIGCKWSKLIRYGRHPCLYRGVRWPCSPVSPVHCIKVDRMSSSLRLLRNNEARVGSRSFAGMCLSVLAEPDPELL